MGKNIYFDGIDDLRKNLKEEKDNATEWINGLDRKSRDALTHIIANFTAAQNDKTMRVIGQLAQLAYLQLLLDHETKHENN